MTATPPAAMQQAAGDAVAAYIRRAYAPDAPGRITSVEGIAAEYAEAALTAALGVCEVDEEVEFRAPDHGIYGHPGRWLGTARDADSHDEYREMYPEATAHRRLVITTQPEPVPAEEQP